MATKLKTNIEAGEPVLLCLSPYGEFPQTTADGQRIVQIVDDAAVDRMVANFSEPVLVDADHSSEEGGATKALAWIREITKTPKGLFGSFDFTPAGAEAVRWKEYRYLSPAWRVDEDGRPVELVSVALTNKPNLPVPAIVNRKTRNDAGEPAERAEDGKEATETASQDKPNEPIPEEAPAAADSATNESGDNTETPAETPAEKEPEMDEIKTALGLPPEAPETDILAAIVALVEKVNTMEKEKAEAAEKAAEAEAEEFAANNCDALGTDKETLKNAFRAAPDAVRAIVANRAKPAAPAVSDPLPVVANAAAPAASPDFNSFESPEARRAFMLSHSADFANA